MGRLVFFTWSLKQGTRQVIEQVFDVVIMDSAFSIKTTLNEDTTTP